MKVMGRCKGDFRLEIHNKVLILLREYNNSFFSPTIGSRWPTMLCPFAWGLMLMIISSVTCVNIPHKPDVAFKSMSHVSVKYKIFSVMYFCGFEGFFLQTNFSNYSNRMVYLIENYTVIFIIFIKSCSFKQTPF